MVNAHFYKAAFHQYLRLGKKIPCGKVQLHIQGPVVQNIVSLTSLLMTSSLTVVAKVFLNTLIFLLQKLLTFFFFFSKNIKVIVIFQDRSFNVTLANNFIKF